MVSNHKMLPVPFMSENTKINQKGDGILFQLDIDKVGERLYKSFVTSKVRLISQIILIGRGKTRNVSKLDSYR